MGLSSSQSPVGKNLKILLTTLIFAYQTATSQNSNGLEVHLISSQLKLQQVSVVCLVLMPQSNQPLPYLLEVLLLYSDFKQRHLQGRLHLILLLNNNIFEKEEAHHPMRILSIRRGDCQYLCKEIMSQQKSGLLFNTITTHSSVIEQPSQSKMCGFTGNSLSTLEIFTQSRLFECSRASVIAR